METIMGLNAHGPAIIGTGVAFTALAVTAVGLRFTSKKFTSAPFGVDDWLLLAALLIYFVAEVLVIRCRRLRDNIMLEGTRTDSILQPISLVAKLPHQTILDT